MATLVRWEPFRELAALQNDMGRLMSTFLGQGQVNGENGERAWMPPSTCETDNELVYAFDIPGISEDEISVEHDDGALTVSGKRERTEQTEDDRFYRYERRFGSFSHCRPAAGRRGGRHPGGLPQRRARDPRPEARGAGRAGSRSAPASRRRSKAPRAGLTDLPAVSWARPRDTASLLLRLAEKLAEAAQAGEHAALDRSERDAEALGELRLRQAAVVGELEGLSLFAWELGQRRLPRRAVL